MNEFIWKHEGKDYTAKALTDNNWKRMNGITRGILLGDCADIKNPIEKREARAEIQSKDYPPEEIFVLLIKREDIRIAFTLYAFRDSKGITEELCAEFWKYGEFSSPKGVMGQLLIASGIPLVINEDDKEVEDKNPILDGTSAEPTSTLE
jgi:hypothetical protein